MTELLARALLMSTPLLYGAVAEVMAERSGVMVTAIEGIFLAGAFGGFVGAFMSGSLGLGLLCAVGCGLLVALLYGWIAVYLKQHQVVAGTAINILVAGLASFFMRVLFGVPIIPLTVEPLKPIALPFLSAVPVVGTVLFNQNILTYGAYLLVPLSYFLLHRTALGLALRSAGENPEAVDTAGLGVDALRFSMVLAAGVLGGLAGAFYSIGYLGMFTTTIIGGRGWIAFAICFLGNWRPLGALAGTLVFGVAEALAISVQSGGKSLFPNELIIAMPYLLTIVLTVARRSFDVPAKLGVPYKKEN